MDNRPGVISDSLIEFGQGGDYHTHSMTEAKESAGFAPLETLPAEWYNNYLYKLDAHINQLQVIARQIQQELSNLLTTAPTPIEPSATDLTQVKAAINQMIEAHTPDIATGSKAGIVVSSAQMNSVSVDADGVMTPNALSDWTETDTVKEYVDAHKPEIATTTDTGVVLASAATNMKGVSVNSTTGAMTVNALSDWTSSDTLLKTVFIPRQAVYKMRAGMYSYEIHLPVFVPGESAFIDIFLDQSYTTIFSTPIRVYVYYDEDSEWSWGFSIVSPGQIFAVGEFKFYLQNIDDDLILSLNSVGDIINFDFVFQITQIVRADRVNRAKVVVYNGDESTATGGLTCWHTYEGDIVASHATSATYLRPAGSSSTLVTTDASGNLKAHTLKLT